MRRMARRPEVRKTRPPRYPPQDTLNSFTQHGQCPLTKMVYFDNSKSNPNVPIYFAASWFTGIMEADRNGTFIGTYSDPRRRLKPTLERYRQYIQNAHVAVVGTRRPWAEAMLLNQGARRITTLEYRKFVVAHNRVVTITPPEFAKNFLEATNNGKTVCGISSWFCITGTFCCWLRILVCVVLLHNYNVS